MDKPENEDSLTDTQDFAQLFKDAGLGQPNPDSDTSEVFPNRVQNSKQSFQNPGDKQRNPFLLRRVLVGTIVLLAVILIVFVLLLQPWNKSGTSVAASPTPSLDSSNDASADNNPKIPEGYSTIAFGNLVPNDEKTSGSIQTANNDAGKTIVILAKFSTPTVDNIKFYLSAGSVKNDPAGWKDLAAAEKVALGPLKAQSGEQVYEVPDGTDMDKFNTVILYDEAQKTVIAASDLNSN